MSSYTEGQIHQLADALESAGFTPAEITEFGQLGSARLNDFRSVINGQSKIVQVPVQSEPERAKKNTDVFLPTVTSDGRSGTHWVESLNGAGYRVSGYATGVLLNRAFVSTTGVYKPVVILGSEFSDVERTTKNVRRLAAKRRYITPSAELAPLLRNKVLDVEIKKLDLIWLVIMHEPITDSGGNPSLLGLSRSDVGRWLDAYWDGPGRRWGRQDGFVFLASQD